MSCKEGSWCDFLLWIICFGITSGVLAIFFVGVKVVIDKLLQILKDISHE